MKYGRKPRGHNPAIPHFSALMAGTPFPAIPAACDYTVALPLDTGMYGNDTLGDCLVEDALIDSSGIDRAFRIPYSGPVVTIKMASGKVLTVTPNHHVLTPRGFVPAKCLKQFDYAISTTREDMFPRLRAMTAKDDVYNAPAKAMEVFASLSLGRSPANLPMSAGSTWDYSPGEKYTIEGGHCVILPAYDSSAKTFKAISWGSVYTMTYAFFSQFVDEAYAIVDLNWLNSTGMTPAGIPFATLEAQMQALRST